MTTSLSGGRRGSRDSLPKKKFAYAAAKSGCILLGLIAGLHEIVTDALRIDRKLVANRSNRQIQRHRLTCRRAKVVALIKRGGGGVLGIDDQHAHAHCLAN